MLFNPMLFKGQLYIYSALRKKGILSIVTTWMELEGVMPSIQRQIQQTTNTACCHLYVESKQKQRKESTS